ncbi:RGS domain-containing protein [Pseudomassariella vexata]|uniref:RGS domain-containing protein n=1 Tax=Pseudomassariella vexata TaxID=1141098 RepID=A0A1Y2DYS8_9PEZI|nr:RGS domain-containing protein [Pseudomassariella vexata]ORY64244.1 RGS domain-containing protein [Pseudomassariella vexata]
MSNSRPSSLAIPRTTSPVGKLPSLSEILSNTAPPPWTLSAFTAYLSQNHCLETLEFILEAERYQAANTQLSAESPRSEHASETICTLWQKLMQTYITPYGPREVNLPAPVRDRLLRLNCSPSSPPQPSELDDAVRIIRELMNDSLLMPFLESVVPVVAESHSHHEESHEARQGRSRLRIPKDLISSREDASQSQSPKTSFLPLLGLGRSSVAANRSTSTSVTEAAETDLATDESGSPNSTPDAEPMTPPVTPPTSDYTFSTSPNTLQRAISGNSWKKMGARLGLTRKNRSTRRSQPINVPSRSNDVSVTPATSQRRAEESLL